MGLWILALPISGGSFIVGKCFSFVSPTLWREGCCSSFVLITGGGWVSERKGRMGRMGKKGRDHEARGTAAVGCEKARGLSPASSCSTAVQCCTTRWTQVSSKIGISVLLSSLSLLYFHLMKIKEIGAFLFFPSHRESYRHRLRRRGARLGCCSSHCPCWSQPARLTRAPGCSCVPTAAHPPPARC